MSGAKSPNNGSARGARRGRGLRGLRGRGGRWRSRLQSLGNFFAFGFGAGLAPVAPGTFGTLAAIPFFLLLTELGAVWYAAVLLAAFVAGIGLCARAAESLDSHDHPSIVWDEMVGLWVALCFIPFSWGAVILGFVLFRVFDILKPWPIGLIDRRMKGGLGIMLDDVAAGVLANLALRWLLPYLPV